jgi:hypothetical protein
MSEPSSVGPEKSAPPKKQISPARNIIGLIVLAAVLVVCWFEYSAVLGFNAAVKALEARTLQEDQGLATVAEAETLLGKEADGPAEDFKEGAWNFNKKTYTWKGLLKQHTLTAYFTKEQDSRLHHFETEGKKVDLTVSRPAPVGEPTDAGAVPTKGQGGRGGGGRSGAGTKSKTGSDAAAKAAPTDKSDATKAAPSDKSDATKASPSDKSDATKASPSDKSDATKAAPSDKSDATKAAPSDKTGATKPEPASDAATKAKSSEPAKAETPK